MVGVVRDEAIVSSRCDRVSGCLSVAFPEACRCVYFDLKIREEHPRSLPLDRNNVPLMSTVLWCWRFSSADVPLGAFVCQQCCQQRTLNSSPVDWQRTLGPRY